MSNKDKENIELSEAYKQAIEFTKSHYENFPVISVFVPKPLRKHVAVIYQFARQADDVADEGELPAEERLSNLDIYERELLDALNGTYNSSFWRVVKDTIDKCDLSTANFVNLLKAFKQDVVKNRYSSFDDVSDYCSNSANPVGRLILELHGIKNSEALYYSDKVCTALQLANFYQDVSVDYKKGRIYISADEMKMYGLSEKEFENNDKNDKFEQLMKYQVDRVRLLFSDGKNLLKYLSGLLRFQIAWTILGGEEILNKIEAAGYETRNFRPTLSKLDMIKLLLRSWKM